MPRLTRWMLKTSLIYLVLAFLVGFLQAFAPQIGSGEAAPVFRNVEPVRVHLFVVGWLTLLIFGVVYWMFPKYQRDLPRGHAWLGWAAYLLLNIGLILRFFGEISGQNRGLYGWVLVTSALLQWLAALAFIANTWPRIKEK